MTSPLARRGLWHATVGTWTPRERARAGVVLGVVALLHAVGFAVLFGLVGPANLSVGTGVFGVGLGITAYTYGLRHAFDADHIAAIDNTTRKLRGEGRRSASVGFWFAMGHATIVGVLAALVAAGTRAADDLTNGSGEASRVLGLLGTLVSGGFLYLIAGLNLIALLGIARVFRAMRHGVLDEHELERHLQSRGVVARVLGRLTGTITRPGQMYLVGLLFGLGFDTASEIALLVLAGSGAASGLPWWAIMVLPLLFAAGMSLLDTLDGLFMSVAYDWALANPVRKVYYNLSVTGLSVAVAFVVGTIELVAVLHDDIGWHGPVVDWVSGIGLEHVGYVVVGLFVVTWAAAVGYWRVAQVDRRWAPAQPHP